MPQPLSSRECAPRETARHFEGEVELSPPAALAHCWAGRQGGTPWRSWTWIGRVVRIGLVALTGLLAGMDSRAATFAQETLGSPPTSQADISARTSFLPARDLFSGSASNTDRPLTIQQNGFPESVSQTSDGEAGRLSDPQRPLLFRGQDPYGQALPPTQAVPPPGAGYYPPQTPMSGGGYLTPDAGAYGGAPGYQQPGYQQPGFGFSPTYADGAAQIPGDSYFNSYPSILGQGTNFADLDVFAPEGQTGRFLFGGAYNSDMGLMGQIILDERNFDIRAFPRSFRDIADGRAFRGGGQRFRMELIPGRELQRYMVSLTEPFLFDSNVSLGVSGYYFTRRYFDFDEQRLGGRLSLGYRLTPDLSLSAAVRAENVEISRPRLLTSPQLNSVLGDHELYIGSVTLTHDTRDHPFMPTEGRFMEIGLSQGFGSFDFPRADLDLRRYFLMYQRPDRSGRHTVSLGTRLGFSGGDTPMFENYFAGGFSTMRGFDFRGASPVENGIVVGGRFQWLNTVEYTFPLTPDDMIKGVAFVDAGTVEPNTQLKWESFRVAPGLGLRIHMPAAGGGGAPLAFDFAVPINRLGTDDTNIFSFYMGFIR